MPLRRPSSWHGDSARSHRRRAYASWTRDLPNGPAIVAAFGAAMALVGLAFALKRLSFRSLSKVLLAATAVAGLLLLAFPRMDQPWLDAIESIAPPVQTAFLTDFEHTTRDRHDRIDRAQPGGA